KRSLVAGLNSSEMREKSSRSRHDRHAPGGTRGAGRTGGRAGTAAVARWRRARRSRGRLLLAATGAGEARLPLHGGSGDPAHLAHAAVAALLRRRGDLAWAQPAAGAPL